MTALGLTVALVVLGASMLLALVRLLSGPSTLDRLVALDAVVAIVLCGLMTFAALTGDSALVPVVVATALVGFLGSTTTARFVGAQRSGDQEPRTDEGER